MIKYDYKFIYDNLNSRGYSLDILRNEKILSQSTLQHLRHDQPISTKTINILCALLECTPQDFMHYIPDENDSAMLRRLARYSSFFQEAKNKADGYEE